jgi:hypothetical protein
MNHQPDLQLPIHRNDSSFEPDQFTENNYAVRQEEKNAEHHDRTLSKSKLLWINLYNGMLIYMNQKIKKQRLSTICVVYVVRAYQCGQDTAAVQ